MIATRTGNEATETHGPAILSMVTINAPGRICHGRQGIVMALWLATNEATVQVDEGTQYLIPWDAAAPWGSLPHGTRGRYQRDGCRCTECLEAAARYMRDRRARQRARRA